MLLKFKPAGMLFLAPVLFFLFQAVAVFAGTFDEDFVVVFVDAQTEEKLGAFPFDRQLLAEATEKITQAHAKGIVFKFYFDRPLNPDSDARLADSFSKIPVVLQAQFDINKVKPNELPPRFFLKGIESNTLVAGDSAWIPFSLLLTNVADVGFVDFGTENVPMVELYQEKPVKSLVLCSIELALQKKARIEPRKQISFGSKTIALTKDDEVKVDLPDPAKIKYYAFHKILDGSVPKAALAGKVVIIAYDGENVHSLPTRHGKVKAHRLFVACLKGVYDLLDEKKAAK